MGKEKNKKKKNNNVIINILIVIVVLLIIAISSLIVYLLITKVYKSDDKKENNNNNKKIVEPQNKTRELTDTEKEDLLSFIDNYQLYYLANKYDGVFSESSNRLLLNAIYHIDSDNVENSSSYDAEQIKVYFNSAFNIDNVNFEDIICPIDDEVLYKYLSDAGKYILSETHPGHGGELLVNDLSHYVISATYDNDLYKINIMYLYGSFMEGYYINDKEIPIPESYVEMTPEQTENYMKDYFNEHYEEYLDTTSYEFAFKKNNGSYYLYKLSNVSNEM